MAEPVSAAIPAHSASVVIPAHNEEGVLRRCLDGLLAGTEPGELDVVVVANACTDRTADVAAPRACGWSRRPCPAR
nr:hypothetical protein GCM10020093_083510 [Planobispora longispora]